MMPPSESIGKLWEAQLSPSACPYAITRLVALNIWQLPALVNTLELGAAPRNDVCEAIGMVCPIAQLASNLVGIN
jgi:hypothetical protein